MNDTVSIRFRWTWVILLFVLMTGPFAPAWAQAPGESVLTVQGAAEARVAPDVATVRLGIVGQAPTADAAQRRVNEVAGDILDAIRDVGIREPEIQTARLVLNPVYSRQESAEDMPQIVAYRASNTVTVRVEDLSRVGRVIDAGLEAGANQLEGVAFGLTDDLPARESALEDAIAEARRKANVMARALDVRLEGVLSVDEGGVFVQAPRMEMARATAFQEAVPTPVSPGEVTVSASVTIRYRIGQD